MTCSGDEASTCRTFDAQNAAAPRINSLRIQLFQIDRRTREPDGRHLVFGSVPASVHRDIPAPCATSWQGWPRRPLPRYLRCQTETRARPRSAAMGRRPGRRMNVSTSRPTRFKAGITPARTNDDFLHPMRRQSSGAAAGGAAQPRHRHRHRDQKRAQRPILKCREPSEGACALGKHAHGLSVCTQRFERFHQGFAEARRSSFVSSSGDR